VANCALSVLNKENDDDDDDDDHGCGRSITTALLYPIPWPLEVLTPLNLARVPESTVSSLSGVWGRTSSEIKFGAFLP